MLFPTKVDAHKIQPGDHMVKPHDPGKYIATITRVRRNHHTNNIMLIGRKGNDPEEYQLTDWMDAYHTILVNREYDVSPDIIQNCYALSLTNPENGHTILFSFEEGQRSTKIYAGIGGRRRFLGCVGHKDHIFKMFRVNLEDTQALAFAWFLHKLETKREHVLYKLDIRIYLD